MRNSLFAILAIALNISFVTAEKLSLPDLNVNYKLKVEDIKLKFLSGPIDNLNEKYQERVKNLKSEYAKLGQLDAALSAEESINIIPTENSIEKFAKFKALSEIHKIYVESEERIQNRYEVELIKVTKSYLENLEKIKVNLTKQENLELAKIVQEKIQSLKESYLYKNRFQIDEALNELKKKKPSRLLNNRFDEGLIAHYPFNGNANDESGNKNNGEVNGATLTADRNGNDNSAYSFDGIDDFIEVENSPELNFDNEMSISFWLNPNAWEDGNNTAGIISKMGDSLPDDGYVIHHDFNRRGKINFRSLGDDYNTTDSVLSLGAWSHWSLTYNEGIIRWFKNGVKDSEYSTKLNDSNLGNSLPLLIGFTKRWLSWRFPSYYNGSIDDIRFYNRALSSSEVSELYELEKPSELNKL